MLAKNWDEAYAACLANPIKDRRVACFRRLVIGMADAGALQELVQMPLTVIGKPAVGPGSNVEVTMADSDDDEKYTAVKFSADELDLYELAADTLADAALEQSRSSRALCADYRGCLYSLHASRANWRRACAAIAFGGSLATAQASMPDADLSQDEGRAIIDAIALAALGSAHSIQLEDIPSHRFIVENELSQYPPAPFLSDGIDDEAYQSVSKKRGRDGQRQLPLFGLDQDQNATAAVNRSTRLLQQKDLIARAIKSIGFRTLLLEQSNPDPAFLAGTKSNSCDAIEELASQGYFSLALAFAKTLCDEHCGARPNGNDIFTRALSGVLVKHIAPTAVNGAGLTPPSDDCEWEGNAGKKDIVRPTPAQIRASVEDIDRAR